MLRRLTTVAALAVLATLSPGTPAWADHTTDHTIAQMTAHYQDPALEPQNKPFALLYLRTTEGMRDANLAGEFSDPQFWDTRVIPTFAGYYLDAYTAWRRGDQRQVDPAWRIAFRADPDKLTCTQLLYLGINASFEAGHRHVVDYLGSEVLAGQPEPLRAFMVRTSVLQRLSASLCDAVLETGDSGELLAELEQANQFLIALDDHRQWYRYHHLFAQLLDLELAEREPELVRCCTAAPPSGSRTPATSRPPWSAP
jgi:hypothetical protein